MLVDSSFWWRCQKWLMAITYAVSWMISWWGNSKKFLLKTKWLSSCQKSASKLFLHNSAERGTAVTKLRREINTRSNFSKFCPDVLQGIDTESSQSYCYYWRGLCWRCVFSLINKAFIMFSLHLSFNYW